MFNFKWVVIGYRGLAEWSLFLIQEINACLYSFMELILFNSSINIKLRCVTWGTIKVGKSIKVRKSINRDIYTYLFYLKSRWLVKPDVCVLMPLPWDNDRAYNKKCTMYWVQITRNKRVWTMRCQAEECLKVVGSPRVDIASKISL